MVWGSVLYPQATVAKRHINLLTFIVTAWWESRYQRLVAFKKAVSKDVTALQRRLEALEKDAEADGGVAPTTLRYTTLHSTTLPYSTLQYTTLHYSTLQHTTVHYTTLQVPRQTRPRSPLRTRRRPMSAGDS